MRWYAIDIAIDCKAVHYPVNIERAPDKIYGDLYAIEVDQGIVAVFVCPMRRNDIVVAGGIHPGK